MSVCFFKNWGGELQDEEGNKLMSVVTNGADYK